MLGDFPFRFPPLFCDYLFTGLFKAVADFTAKIKWINFSKSGSGGGGEANRVTNITGVFPFATEQKWGLSDHWKKEQKKIYPDRVIKK